MLLKLCGSFGSEWIHIHLDLSKDSFFRFVEGAFDIDFEATILCIQISRFGYQKTSTKSLSSAIQKPIQITSKHSTWASKDPEQNTILRAYASSPHTGILPVLGLPFFYSLQLNQQCIPNYNDVHVCVALSNSHCVEQKKAKQNVLPSARLDEVRTKFDTSLYRFSKEYNLYNF